MTRKWYLGWLFVIAFQVFAQPNATWVNENAPESYVVRPGDTLWEIACKFLRDPWDWQEVWRANPDIANPNLIYPGDRIFLHQIDGKPRLGITRKRRPETHITPYHRGTVVLHPQIRVLPADRAIPTIPLNAIEPFFNESRVVTDEQVKKCPKIVALDEDHLVVGRGDLMYVSGLSPNNPDTVFAVFRPGKTYLDPKTNAPLGIEGLVLGKAQLQLRGDPARFEMIRSFAEVRIGDQIIETAEEALDPYFVPKLPQGSGKGQIISVFGGVNQISQFQILVITGGTDRQREVGDVLDIYQTQKDIPMRVIFQSDKHLKYPPLKIGRCLVFRVFNKVSYVLVMKATRPIYLLDMVTRP